MEECRYLIFKGEQDESHMYSLETGKEILVEGLSPEILEKFKSITAKNYVVELTRGEDGKFVSGVFLFKDGVKVKEPMLIESGKVQGGVKTRLEEVVPVILLREGGPGSGSLGG